MSDFGGKLRLARERRGTSLQQISASTKISVAALEALERNDISKLPGGIFSRSFVRSYAHEVGLDPDETVREFLERFQPSAAPSPVVPASGAIHSSVPEEESAFDTQQRIAGVVLKLLLISVPLIVLVLYFTMRTRPAGPVSSAASIPPPTVATSTTPAAVPEATPTPVPIGTSPPARAVATAGAGVTGIPIELHTTAECWVRVTADGKRVLSRLMKEGDKETLAMQNKAVIEVGNAGGLAFSINGRPGKPLGQPGQVRTVLITKDTISQFLQ
jgi:cytoskeletal protein RodZ